MNPPGIKGDPNLTVFIVIMAVGFVLGVYGHVIKSNVLIIVGIVMVFTATIVLPLLIFGGSP